MSKVKVNRTQFVKILSNLLPGLAQKELIAQAYALKRKVSLLGGDEKQFEMNI